MKTLSFNLERSSIFKTIASVFDSREVENTTEDFAKSTEATDSTGENFEEALKDAKTDDSTKVSLNESSLEDLNNPLYWTRLIDQYKNL